MNLGCGRAVNTIRTKGHRNRARRGRSWACGLRFLDVGGVYKVLAAAHRNRLIARWGTQGTRRLLRKLLVGMRLQVQPSAKSAAAAGPRTRNTLTSNLLNVRRVKFRWLPEAGGRITTRGLPVHHRIITAFDKNGDVSDFRRIRTRLLLLLRRRRRWLLLLRRYLLFPGLLFLSLQLVPSRRWHRRRPRLVGTRDARGRCRRRQLVVWRQGFGLGAALIAGAADIRFGIFRNR